MNSSASYAFSTFHPRGLTGTELEIIVAPFGKELNAEKQVDPRRKMAIPAQ